MATAAKTRVSTRSIVQDTRKKTKKAESNSTMARFFRNGWKLDLLFLAMIFMIIASSVVAVTTALDIYEKTEPFTPLNISTPNILSRINGEPVIIRGKGLTYEVDICNSLDHVIGVDVYFAQFNEQTTRADPPARIVQSTVGSFGIEPGCQKIAPVILVPDRVEEGIWTYEAKVRVAEGKKKPQIIEVTVGPFAVISDAKKD